ncbi:AI-2E family transporter [Streptococcus sp. DD10]|uniref:AI-2E family transporter n=1 Tax=Streptococcus sp. DD10 TaxID=1777878 RepID=UPI000835BE41|nr:AI-2E family transporter [Streptococcus sp. DD10]
MFQRSKLFFWTVEVLLASLVFFLWRQMGDTITPVVSVINTILIPFLIAAFLYYLLNPVVKLLEKYAKVSRVVSSLLAVLIVIALVVFGVVYLLPILISQLTSLINSSQYFYEEIQTWITSLSDNPAFQSINIERTIQELNLSYVDILRNLLDSVTSSLGNVVSVLINTIFILVMTPIFLLYFLLDGYKLLPFLEKTVLKRDRLQISSLLVELNRTIARYISGISIDALIIFALAYIGYSIIGLRYALIFAIFSGFANLIPYIGPSLGLIPMTIAYAVIDPQKLLFALPYMLIVQQVDGNILYPRIVGGVMKVHPITIMVLLLLASNVYGILGMVVVIPVYSILKEIVKFLTNLYENHKAAQQSKKNREYGIVEK